MSSSECCIEIFRALNSGSGCSEGSDLPFRLVYADSVFDEEKKLYEASKLYAAEKYEDAEKLLLELPESHKQLRALAANQYRLGKFPEAENNFAKAADTFPWEIDYRSPV